MLRYYAQHLDKRSAQALTFIQSYTIKQSIMGWDNEYYKAIYDFTSHELRHVDYRLAEKYKNNICEWVKTFLPLISQCIHDEDYEGAKGTSDAIRDFVNSYLPKEHQIPKDKELRLPEYKQVKIKGIICFWDDALLT